MTITSPSLSTDPALGSLLDGRLARAADDGTVLGVTLAITNRDGLVYAGAAGHLRHGDDEEARSDSLVWIASQSKLLTVIAALQLVEEGRIGLDEPVGDVLPIINSVPVFDGFAPDGSVLTRPASTRVTLRHLITHTAGTAYPFFNATVRDIQAREQIPFILTGEYASLYRTPWLFEPGSAFEYGTSIDWLGLVIEAITGKELVEVLTQRIILPLGLSDTSPFLTGDRASRVLQVSARVEDGTLDPLDFALPESPEFQPGGHLLYGTVVDYVRLLQALLNGGTVDGVRVLKPETVAAGLRNQIGDLAFTPITTADPATTNDVNPFPGVAGKWGYFGLINESATSWGRPAGTTFWAGLANTYYWLDNERGIAGAIATQILPFADPRVLELLVDVESAAGDWAADR